MEAAARAYINSPRGVAVTGGAITVSKIYDWYIADFGHDEKSVLAHLIKYAAPALRKQLSAIGKIEGVAYDWRLNGAGTYRAAAAKPASAWARGSSRESA